MSEEKKYKMMKVHSSLSHALSLRAEMGEGIGSVTVVIQPGMNELREDEYAAVKGKLGAYAESMTEGGMPEKKAEEAVVEAPVVEDSSSDESESDEE